MKQSILLASALLLTLLPWALPARAATAPTLLASNGVAGMPDSSDKVHIQAWFPAPVSNQGTRALSVRLRTAPGWHVNAHPASLPSLIATTLSATAGGKPVTLKTTYPSGEKSGIVLGGTAIKVYDNNTTLNAVLPPASVAAAKAAGRLGLTLHVQSCSNRGICLPPANVHTTVAWDQNDQD